MAFIRLSRYVKAVLIPFRLFGFSTAQYLPRSVRQHGRGKCQLQGRQAGGECSVMLPCHESMCPFSWGCMKTALLFLLAFALSLCIFWPQVKQEESFGSGASEEVCIWSLPWRAALAAAEPVVCTQEAECVLRERLVRGRSLQAACPMSPGTLEISFEGTWR